MTRHDIRELVRRGLSVTRGNYRGLLELFRIPSDDYKRFMNFLTTHETHVDYREFRSPTTEWVATSPSTRALLPPLVHHADVPVVDGSDADAVTAVDLLCAPSTAEYAC